MEWRGTGFVLGTRRHGETSVILDVLTPERGRHAGLVRGGTSRRIAPALQPGTELDLVWRARLEAHIGTFTVEPVRSRAALAMDSRLALAGLSAVTALLAFCLPEREAVPDLHGASAQLLDLLGQDEIWPLAYLRWEMTLLAALGYGLDLRCCAVTGAREGLAYISPRTGRAVSAAGAGDWAARLLPLPPVMLGQGTAADAEIVQALAVTGHFLEAHVARENAGQRLPAARARLITEMERRG